jgi:predicted DNA-binding transcriptional regulator AlpA
MFNPDLMDVNATCAFFGGSKPIDPATLYRGIATEMYPRPVKLGRKTSRWLRSECEEALRKLIAARDRGKAA